MADGSVTIEVELKKDQLEKELKSLKRTINNTLPSASKTLSAFANGFSKLGSLATKVGKACSIITAGITGVFTVAGTKAKNFITTYEGAINLFKKKLGDTGAKEMYESLLSIAKASTFAQESIVSAGQILVAMGVNGKTTAKYMQLVTDAVAGMGGSGVEIESLAEAIGKMSNQVNLHTDDLNQLATQGLPVWDVLAKKYGTTKDAVQDMASKGMIPATETLDFLSEALEGNIDGFEEWSVAGNALSQKGGTLKGAIDGLNSSIRSFGLNLLGMNINKDQVANYQKLIQVVNLFGKTIENIGSKFSFVSDWIGVGLDKVKSTLEKFNETINGMSAETLQSIAKTILGLATAGPILLGVGNGFGVISSVFSELSGGVKIIENFTGKISGMFGIITKVPGNLSKATKGISNFVGDISSGFGLIFSNVTPKVTGFFGNIGNLFSSFGGKVSSFLSPVTTAFANIGGKIGSFLSPVKTVLDKTILNTTMFAQLVKFNIGESINNAFPNVTAGLGKISEAFGGVFEGIIGKIGSFAKKFFPIFVKAFNIMAIVGVVVAGLGLLESQFGEQIDNILNVVTQKGPQIINNLVNGIVSKLPNLISKGGELLQNLLNAIITNLPTLINGGMQIIGTLVDGISQQLPTLIPMVIQLIMTIFNSLIENLPIIIEAGLQLLVNFVQGIVNAIPQLIEMLPTIITTICDVITEELPNIIEAGITILVSLIDGLINAIPQLVEMLPTIINTIITTLLDNLPLIIDAGIQILIALINGLIEAIPMLIEMLPQIITTIVTVLAKNFPKIVDAGSKIILSLIAGIGALLCKLSEGAGKIIETIWNTLKELPRKSITMGKRYDRRFYRRDKKYVGKFS